MKFLNVADSHLYILVSFACAICIPIGVGTSAYATSYGIILDNTCLTYLKNNITSDCPSYEDIITLFPDTSVRKISGDFGYYHGIYQRLPTNLTNSFEYYRFTNNTLLFVDPPMDTKSRIYLIEIKANLNEYKLPKQAGYNAIKHSLTVGTGRYIDDCRLAYVDARQWIFLVGDTMNYMSNGCSAGSTTFISQITKNLNRTTHDITTTYKYQLAQWQKASIERCGFKICRSEGNHPAP